MLVAGGLVRYWGRNVGAAQNAPGTLQHGGANVANMTFVDAWTSLEDGNNSTGGVATGATGTEVYQWFRTGTGVGDPVVAKVTGISGTVMAAESNDGFSYVLTTAGLYYWGNASAARPSTPPSSAAPQVRRRSAPSVCAKPASYTAARSSSRTVRSASGPTATP